VAASILSRAYVDNAYVFTFVRNPWDRLVSYARYRSQTPESFPGVVASLETIPRVGLDSAEPGSQANPQVSWLNGIVPDTVGRYETLARDWRKIAEKCDLLQTLPHLKASTTGSNDYHRWYTRELWDRVAKHYREDIERFYYYEDWRGP